MQTLQRARNVLRLNSQISQDGTFVHYLCFVLNIPLLTFSYRNFFPLFVCFDILWQLATTHERDNTRDRDANSSRQNDFTWCGFFCRGNKSSSCSLARFCRRKHKKSTDRASRSWKIWARLVGKSIILQMQCCAWKSSLPFLPCKIAFRIIKITIMENVNSAILTIFVHCFCKQPS